jgi:PDZ domain-containing protein
MATWERHGQTAAAMNDDTQPTVPAASPPAQGPPALGPPAATMATWRPPPRGRRPSFFIGLGLLAVAVIGIPTAVATHYANQYFLFSPGTAPVITTSTGCRPAQGELALPDGAPCVRLVVPRDKVHDVDGKLLMVDVEVSQAGPLQWAEYELGLLGKQRQMVPVVAYAGQTPTSELGCQDTQEMGLANEDAAITALESLHYRVNEAPLGAEINAVYPNTPAWSAGIKCDDLITAVNGRKVTTAADFTDLLEPVRPGTSVTLTDHPVGGGAAKQVKVRLVAPPAELVTQGFANRAYLGVSVDTRVKPELPFAVSIDAGDIGGPSAGLAFTLAILDVLSNGRLTGGHTVAATGTISPNGAVGDVGGVQEKAAAVEKAGAQVFFVPEVEYATARDAVGNGLQVVPVTTLAQVLRILHQRYGGEVPK